MIIDALKDLIAYTHGLGFIEYVKLTGNDEGLRVESMSDDKTVVMYGKINAVVPGLSGTVGLSRMGILDGLLKFDGFNDNIDGIKIVEEKRQGVLTPTEIAFKSKSGHKANYRFMSPQAVEESLRVPPFKGVTWDITIEPTTKNIKELSYFSSILSSEANFSPSISEGVLNLSIGSGPTDRSVIPFASNVEGTFKKDFSWPLSNLLAILKMNANSKCVMQFSERGALKVTLDNGISVYEYILPASS